MGLFNKNKTKQKKISRIELVADKTNGFYAWNGRLYENDIIRSCVRPKSQAIGKLEAKHLQSEVRDPKNYTYIKLLLSNPNPYMTGQMLQEKMANQLALNNNAFAIIVRDDFGFPNSIYPITCPSVETVYDEQGNLSLKFSLKSGKTLSVSYDDVIHLRRDYNEDDIFGTSPMRALLPLMTVIDTTDKGIINAIKNSAIIKWLMRFTQNLNPKDMEEKVENFTKSYLSVNGSKSGVVAEDSSYAIEQVKTDNNYIPEAEQMTSSIKRVYNFFNTNENIINSSYTDDQWNSYYESEIEPMSMQMSNEYTNKLFTIKERSFKNKIVFDSANLQYASMQNKLGFVAMVDRGSMTPNEWRKILNLSPIEGGDDPIRRLDTAVVGNEPKTEE